METVNPLTWELKSSTHSIGETGDYETVVWIQKGMLQLIANDDDAEDELKEVVELLNDTSSRVRALEEELEMKKIEASKYAFECDRAKRDRDRAEQELERVKEENKRLQERLEAADEVISTLSKQANWLESNATKLAIKKYNSLKPITQEEALHQLQNNIKTMHILFLNDCAVDGCYKPSKKPHQMCEEHQKRYDAGEKLKAFYGKTVQKSKTNTVTPKEK